MADDYMLSIRALGIWMLGSSYSDLRPQGSYSVEPYVEIWWIVVTSMGGW